MLTIVAQFVIFLSVQYNQELLKITLKENIILAKRNKHCRRTFFLNKTGRNKNLEYI